MGIIISVPLPLLFRFLLSLCNQCCFLMTYMRLLLAILQLSLVSFVYAQGAGLERWMMEIDDSVAVSSLSIPGAHDAATGEGLHSLPGFGVTQSLDIKGLWESGVRAFDLRPAVKDTLLYIYHGRLRTTVSFSEALGIICAQLERYPSEFAIVLLREESDSENESERSLWPHLVGKAIQEIGNKVAVFSPDMKVADARGKVLFLTRNAYNGMERGALLAGWNHSKDGNANAQIISSRNGEVTRLQVQDYYAPTNARKRLEKLEAVKHYFLLASKAPEGVWTINFLSGYSTTWLGCTPLATTSGYKRNAAWLHPLVLEGMENVKHPMGIVFMDYAGVDRVDGGLWHWKPFNVYGRELVRTVIESNSVSAE